MRNRCITIRKESIDKFWKASLQETLYKSLEYLWDKAEQKIQEESMNIFGVKKNVTSKPLALKEFRNKTFEEFHVKFWRKYLEYLPANL